MTPRRNRQGHVSDRNRIILPPTWTVRNVDRHPHDYGKAAACFKRYWLPDARGRATAGPGALHGRVAAGPTTGIPPHRPGAAAGQPACSGRPEGIGDGPGPGPVAPQTSFAGHPLHAGRRLPQGGKVLGDNGVDTQAPALGRLRWAVAQGRAVVAMSPGLPVQAAGRAAAPSGRLAAARPTRVRWSSPPPSATTASTQRGYRHAWTRCRLARRPKTDHMGLVSAAPGPGPPCSSRPKAPPTPPP